MRTTDPGDAARIELLLAELRLPAVKQVWVSLAAQADKEGWPAGRFLAALAEHEIAERGRRRLERHLAEARLPPGKTLDTFDFQAVPVVSKAQVMALAAGAAWLNNGAHLLFVGPPGGGKRHLAAAFGFALVENGWRVLFTRTADLVQRLPTGQTSWPRNPSATQPSSSGGQSLQLCAPAAAVVLPPLPCGFFFSRRSGTKRSRKPPTKPMTSTISQVRVPGLKSASPILRLGTMPEANSSSRT